MTTLLTFDEFLDLPDLHAGKRELINGELIESPPTTAHPNKIADRLTFALKNYLLSQSQPHDRAPLDPVLKSQPKNATGSPCFTLVTH